MSNERFTGTFSLPDELPDMPEFDPKIRRAPDRGYRLTSVQTRQALKNALRYVPEGLHAALAPEFLSELKTRGSIYAYHYNHIATGMIGVYQGVAPGNCALATGLVFDEIRRLCDEEVPADELEMNREQIKGSLLMSLESPGTRASRIAKGLLFLGRVPAVEEITAKFDAVTAGEVRDFARGVFRRENCALMTLGPDGGAPFAEVPLP